ncbi:hypothetical protein PILCRDRAFT_91279 [Piloderma croceum F 1598]|uniref:Uncharacterized protein n=1 Tax=Piloderma croceum (strain F 1598) TaxID=765440 RepID=A0A0C3BI97_PILCF|nr:hypothetical protein PILCRDRAFT_91279 [Piloderma croceum F 1598]
MLQPQPEEQTAVGCAVTPLVLGSTLQSHPTEVKGAFTILFILWQAVALVFVGDILNYVFSSEWSHHFLQKGTLVLGKTDRISTLMAGRLFRTAFLTSLVFVALAGLALGVVSIGVAFIAQPMSVPIGNVTVVSEPILGAYVRATHIVQQEQLQSAQFGYRNANNQIVGWPPMGLPTNGSGPIEYFSDVVKYNHSCTWKTPVWDNSTQSYTAGGVSWVGFPLNEPARRPNVTSQISPLLRSSSLQGPLPKNGVSGYLFTSSNSSLPSTCSVIDLSSLPSAYNPIANGEAPLSSILVCDPQLSVSGGKVKLDVDGSLEVTTSGYPSTTDNISLQLAQDMFINCLSDAVSAQEPGLVMNIAVNYVAVGMFLNSSTQLVFLPPLDIDEINKKMDSYVSSASKAYTDGYYVTYNGDSFIPTTHFNTVPVDTVGQVPKLALMASKSLYSTRDDDEEAADIDKHFMGCAEDPPI